jgi:hypothetical protein
MNLTQTIIAAILTEWERRYREEPTKFMHQVEILKYNPDIIGDKSAAYFISLGKEMGLIESSGDKY